MWYVIIIAGDWMLLALSPLQQLQNRFLLLQQGPLDPSEIRLVLRFQYNDYYPVVVEKKIIFK